MFTFTPLLGAQSSSAASQSLLELDGGVKILVDVGWPEDFDPEALTDLERYGWTILKQASCKMGPWKPLLFWARSQASAGAAIEAGLAS